MRNGDITQFLALDRYTKLELLSQYIKEHGEGSLISRVAYERIKNLKPMKVIMYDLDLSRAKSNYLFLKFSRKAMALYRAEFRIKNTLESNKSFKTA